MRTVRSRKVVSFLPTDCGVWFAKTDKAHHGAKACGEPCRIRGWCLAVSRQVAAGALLSMGTG